MTTPFDEGWLTGYRCKSGMPPNPYKKGDPLDWAGDQLQWIEDWDRGFYEGRRQVLIDIADKDLASTR